ncbi:MAG: hypothetical protein FJW96_15475 [Actinobacteria bacterium]|nr:hypothetical protein [Actinomycetota bacterium]
MDRLIPYGRIAAVAAAVLAVAGCGGGGEPEGPCDDAGFRNQSEELYVAIATAQNAQGSTAPSVRADLEKGVAVLRAYIDRHPPCDEELEKLAESERQALERLDAALEALARGESGADDLAAAVDALGAVEVALRG